MNNSPSSVREIGSTRPRLRPGLRFTFQEFGGERCCVMEDPVSSKFHRVGLAEYRFLTHLDGQTTFSEAFARASIASGGGALSEHQAVTLLSWLVENRLADFGGTVPEDLLDESGGKQVTARLRNFLNLLFIKIPLGRPDGLLDRVHPRLAWLCGWFVFGIWAILVTAALIQVGLNADRLVRGTEGILSSSNWLWLGVVWISLKLWHEFWHGLVCKHHGGAVREAGVLLVLFTPLGYVDASSSWAFPSKWKRIHVAAAGMYGEFFLAALATFVWSSTSPGIANTIALNTMIMAGTVTLLFNLNPLMRFDGYYILVDLIGLPNLYTRATQLLKSLSKRWLLGVRTAEALNWSERDTWILLIYGIASLIWRLFIFATLLIAASLLFRGGGLILAVIAFLFWLWPSVSGLVMYLRDGAGSERPARSLAAIRISALVLSLLLVAFFPFSPELRAPGLVQFTGQTILRAECPGFVTGIHVRDGMDVTEGTLLVTLSNEEAEARLEDIALRYQRQLLKSSQTRAERPVAAYEAEISTLEALRTQHGETLKYVQTLDVTAPQDGRVIAPGLPALRGSFLHTGDEILRVARPEAGEIAVPVSQNDIDAFRRHLGFPVAVRIHGRGRTTEGILRRLSARAETQIDHPALTSLGGGPLAVKARGVTEADSLRPEPGHELVQPVFWAVVDLTGDGAFGLRAGERATVKFRSRNRLTVGRVFHSRMTQLFQWIFTHATIDSERF